MHRGSPDAQCQPLLECRALAGSFNSQSSGAGVVKKYAFPQKDLGHRKICFFSLNILEEGEERMEQPVTQEEKSL